MSRLRPRPSHLALALGLAVTALCPLARAEEPKRVMRIDPDAHPPPATRVPLLLTGAAVTGAFYGGAVGAYHLWPEARGAEHLLIPVVGPWMKLFQTGCSETTAGCNTFMIAVGAVLAGLDGLGQAGGVGLMLEGIFLQTRTAQAAPTAGFAPLRPDSSARSSDAASGFSWRPVPFSTGSDGFGLGVAGAF